MARLLVVPIEDRGHAILVTTRYADTELIGFVLFRTMADFLQKSVSACDCMSIVRKNLLQFERELHRLSQVAAHESNMIPCIEINADALKNMKLNG